MQHQPKACQFCGDRLTHHPKVGLRQIACKRHECQRARKRANLKSFCLTDSGYKYENVRRYRASHPDYQRQWRKKRKEKLKAQYSPKPPSSWQPIAASLIITPPTGDSERVCTFYNGVVRIIMVLQLLADCTLYEIFSRKNNFVAL